MKAPCFVLATVATMCMVLSASAQNIPAAPAKISILSNIALASSAAADCGTCGGIKGTSCCCGRTAYVVGFESVWLRYHRSDGVGVNDADEFDFDFSPRITFGYVAPDGLGLRLRYWDISTENDQNQSIQSSVDTYTIDGELFQDFQIGCYTNVELSVGIRYNDWEDLVWVAQQETITRDTFSGVGGIIGIEATRSVAIGGSLYARLRESILMDSWGDDGVDRRDVTRNITEIGFGYKHSACLPNGSIMTARAGVEWQNWDHYVEAHGADDTTEAAGFGGFVFGGQVTY